MKRRILIPIALALLLMLALAPATFAAPGLDDTVVEANEVVNNDVVVLDGDLTVREGAVVNGDVIVFNGDAVVDGRVNGSLTLFNGDLEAGESAVVTGECVLLNGALDGHEGIGKCTAVKNLELPPFAIPPLPAIPQVPEIAPVPTMPAMPEIPAAPAVPAIPGVPRVPDGRDDGPSAWARMVGLISSTLMFGLLALLAGAIMPNQLRQIVGTARAKPLVSGLAGVLTAVAVPSLIVLLIPLSILLTLVCIGLLGFPIMLLLAVGLVLGGLLGWVAAGTWLGARLFARGKDDHVVRSAALGTMALTFGVGLLSFIPFVFGESLLAFVIASIGLGAVALTQFGLKPFPRRPEASSGGPDAGKVESVINTLPPEERPAGA